MSTCGEPCDGCANRAEHHLCDACCHDEVDAIQKENRELREKLEWQAACTKALMESQERLAAELKEAREWAKERSEFAAAETEHANRWSVRAHKAEAEVERLRNALAAISLDEYESTSSASEKVHGHARIARKALYGEK